MSSKGLLDRLNVYRLWTTMSIDCMPKEYDKDLFHYTSAEGFASILFGESDSVVLWASRHDCLNDVSEGSVVEEVFQDVCKELYEKGIITDYLYRLFIKIKSTRTIIVSHKDRESEKLIKQECDRYISSFSKNKDSLAMWNYYSKGTKYEGFNVGFSPCNVKMSLSKFSKDKAMKFRICPVIYDRNEQKRLIEELLLRAKQNYQKDWESIICDIISDRLTQWRLVFKQECFKHEEEVRIIVDIAKEEKKIPIKHRICAGYVVPYIEIKLDKRSVTHTNFGPLQCEEDQKKSQRMVMKEMLERNGYSAIVDNSKIPVRY